ncbi:MAG: hypothetical protein JWP75_985 [Frondihabitans sp.]|nr:hypothetical protein [Frondihabitans sp.]
MNTIEELEVTDDSTLRERKKRKTRQIIHDVALRHVARDGLAGVTVEAICEEALVSQRTFFNYFPSKSAAALGFSAIRISETERIRFLERAPAGLLSALCHLVDAALQGPVDRTAVRAVIASRPELRPAMLQWMAELYREILDLAQQVTSARTARVAITLVLGALVEAVNPDAAAADRPLADRLLEIVSEAGVIARELLPA